MSQEFRSISEPNGILKHSQIQALKSLSLLLVREINSLDERQNTLEGEIENQQPICLVEELQRFEVNMIRCALIRTTGRQIEAAKLLGLKPTTLYEKIKRYNINPTDLTDKNSH